MEIQTRQLSAGTSGNPKQQATSHRYTSCSAPQIIKDGEWSRLEEFTAGESAGDGHGEEEEGEVEQYEGELGAEEGEQELEHEHQQQQVEEQRQHHLQPLSHRSCMYPLPARE